MVGCIIIKWLHGILTKPLAIIKSIYFNIKNKHQDLADYRLSICNQCAHKLTIKVGDICDQCGCILENKTRLEEEKCDLCKW